MLAFWFAANVARTLLRGIGAKADQGKNDVFNLLGQIAKAVLLITGGITALGTLGVNVTAMVAGPHTAARLAFYRGKVGA